MLTRATDLAASAPDQALAELRNLFRRYPEHPGGTALLRSVLQQMGQSDPAARALSLSRALHSPDLLRAARLLNERKVAQAEAILRPYVRAHPEEPSGHLLLADLHMRSNQAADAEAMLRRALELAPCYTTARSELAQLLFRQNRLEEALAELDELIPAEPDNQRSQDLKARALNRLGRVEEAAAIYEAMIEGHPEQAITWAHYGHSLRFLGRLEESVAAYRKALQLDDELAPVWWSLANIKTVTLEDADIDSMLVALAKDDLSTDKRVNLHFALGKATEDQGLSREAFAHYLQGNALHRTITSYDPQWMTSKVDLARSHLDEAFFAERAGWGASESGPIFVVGMPRAGSTLVEQILASHPDIEGLAELPYLAGLAKQLADETGLEYPRCLTELTREGSARLGQAYLTHVAPHRTTRQPLYVDKNPNNWLFVDLVQLILPNAKIVDVRRHPLACGVSNFRQHFAEGQLFSYSFEHIGRYYRDYISMMQRVDDVLPRRMYRIVYERLVESPPAVIEELLAFLGVQFDDRCLSFHENSRAVRTPSSEQVRRPINKSGLEKWRAFERWVDPLKVSLGSVLDSYPAVPEDLRSSGATA